MTDSAAGAPATSDASTTTTGPTGLESSTSAVDAAPAASTAPAVSPSVATPATINVAPVAPVGSSAPSGSSGSVGSSAPVASEGSALGAAKEHAAELASRASDALDRAGEALDRAGDAAREATANAVTRMRNNATLLAKRGQTTIANEVVEKIAGIAAREVPGVYDLGGDVARVFSAVKERLNLGEESASQGVSVELEGKNAVIRIVIVLEFGFQVQSVTDAVRGKVITSVESMLGLDVTAVDVVVDDVHIDDDGPIGDDVARAAGYNPVTTAIVVGE